MCDIFVHSPVYRIGGDEFVIILQKKDLDNSDKLLKEFEKALNERASGEFNPWEAPSVAVGVAYYDRNKDTDVEDVFRRADDAMYERKKEMKAERLD